MAGSLIVISGYSGVGKGTIIPHVMKKVPNVKKTISCTTRDKRVGEEDGINYYFITVEDFKNKIDNDDFVEYTQTYTNYYGTLKSEVEKHINAGQNVILELDVVGAANIKKMYPDSMSIFIEPPSLEELKRRLVSRGSENQESLQRRLDYIEYEKKQVQYYDYVVINHDVLQCADDIIKIINNKIKENR